MGVVSSALRSMFFVGPAKPKLYFGGDAAVVLTEQSKTTMSEFLQAQVPSLFQDYKPAWWIPTGHLQTAYCVFGDFTKHNRVVYERTLLRLTDGGTIGLDWTAGHEDFLEDTPILVVKHGLTGGSYESYVRAVISRVCAPTSEGGLGIRAVVCNFRGCANVPLTSLQFYSAGHTDDLRTALSYIRTTYPKAPLVGIGFSLGASVVTRYVAEEGVKSRLLGAVTLGCPWDLAANSIPLEGRFFYRQVYSMAMGTNLARLFRRHLPSILAMPDSPQKRAFEKAGIFDKIADLKWEKGKGLIDLDNVMTIYIGGSWEPHGPFPMKRAEEYYAWGSSHHVLPTVRVPLLALNAGDDPIVEKLPYDAGANPYVTIGVTRGGGHLGWFQDDGTRWFAKPALEFISAVLRTARNPDYTEFAIKAEPDAEGFVREEGVEREHLGWRILKDHEIVVADATTGPGITAGL
ncbi:AB-hydrolase YheT [Auriculariales sp. MPI-PUGE-AT-0066]|nr:AB-hydrolase YheT [Auriculariales sp. MPI-PUGE-AT-0066]